MDLAEGSRGAKRNLRARMPFAKELIRQGKTDFGSARDAYRQMATAFRTAQGMNKQWGRTTVYHMIHPDRVAGGGRVAAVDLDKVLGYLMSGSSAEVSVSVDKGVWGTGLVLEGEGKLLAYWDTDVHTAPSPAGRKVPQAASRAKDSHHWDEGLVRLSDVEWVNLYIGEDEEVMYRFGGYRAIEQLARKHGLRLKHVSDATGGGALQTRYNYEEDIKDLENEVHGYWSQVQHLYFVLYPQRASMTPEQQKLLDDVYPDMRDMPYFDHFGMQPEEIYNDMKGLRDEWKVKSEAFQELVNDLKYGG